ncbi:Rrf2 family transcriptional regulator [Lysinibacillus sp. FSL M8-0216]|uniref:Transcriptional regulator, BadM/Rrf2 family n=1 Tax=Lysinibacillus fusiformis TaxID=28031 RepID=A0A1H9R6L3_9BACI|nr:Rrf2 family transcriptional regulator [Lysinibacillus fusiformis]MCG7435246.1 Rrf2 family transcriptional regulator [Lysinibacillus fusiformis]SCY73712.1 transcriptional regulator, BadM/Rrf2 family [Lysinibacillus fusiformis]SEO29705.1 transcriptional regulator, BadM/Rrf2 family [Lysinibacillus fusiformis]SER68330.1 transcriptional regulator, BadM/Rrf2 family [Lysinibacillus fusiformis]
MINIRLSVAIHVLSLISTDSTLSSEKIASSVNTNPVVIRRISSDLKKAGILTSKVGVPGSSLTRDPSDITLFDIYKAVHLEKELFPIHNNPNPDCHVGKKIQHTLNVTFESVQTAMENELKNKTLESIMNHLNE